MKDERRAEMIEHTITPEDIAKARAGIKDWCNPDRTLNVQKMQSSIKKDLWVAHKRNMRWQAWALKTGRIGNLPED